MKKIIILLFILTNILFASIGQITALVGEIKISRDSKELLAKLGEELEKNDVINSSKGAKAQITLDDNTIITIGQNSTLNIFDYVFDESKPKDSKASFGFMKGSFKSITGKIGKINKDRFKLKTKSASIGIRGTTIIGNQRMIACTGLFL
ncbi:MAG: FecR family protein [Arcobacter sp.]|uniref:FecR family protein n=1 Tax=Arcobacter sp. TaxID=1872629 RepID=UPI003B0020DB